MNGLLLMDVVFPYYCPVPYVRLRSSRRSCSLGHNELPILASLSALLGQTIEMGFYDWLLTPICMQDIKHYLVQSVTEHCGRQTPLL